MSLADQAMRYYPYVVHPITVLGVGIVVLIYHEWDRQDADRVTLWRRLAGFLGVGVLALVPTASYFLLLGVDPVQSTRGNSLRMDLLVVGGLFVTAGLLWYLWRRNEWGDLVPGAMVALAAVAVPYALLSPFWNVSGHVIIALMPTLYLTLVHRAFWPTLVFPVVMVPNRIYLDAHTWEQTIGGFLLATVVVLGVYWLQADASLQPELASTTT